MSLMEARGMFHSPHTIVFDLTAIYGCIIIKYDVTTD
jgi:hypothetical protein